MKHLLLLEYFEEITNANDICKKVTCTTCGGLTHVIEANMTEDLITLVEKVLAEISLDDYFSFGEWTIVISRISPEGVASVFERELSRIDITDVRKLDKYLLNAREVQCLPMYRKLLEQGLCVAISTEDESLIETIALVLGTTISDYDDFLKLAISKSRSNKKIHRVLYNYLREIEPKIRDFVGDGSSVSPYW